MPIFYNKQSIIITNLIICVTRLDIQGIRTSLNIRTKGDKEGVEGLAEHTRC